LRRPTSTAALPAATRAISTARSPTRPGPVELDPNNALGPISLGVLHAKKNELGLAYADFGKATEIEPSGGFDGYRVRVV
jgi:hypothetical protein